MKGYTAFCSSPILTPHPSQPFHPYLSPSSLQAALGLEGLKQELQARGLKCGGTLSERAARLFLLSHTPLDQVDAKHRAKPAQSAGGKKRQ